MYHVPGAVYDIYNSQCHARAHDLIRYRIICLFMELKNNSCGIEEIVESHLCMLCVVLRSRVLRVLVWPHEGRTVHI